MRSYHRRLELLTVLRGRMQAVCAILFILQKTLLILWNVHLNTFKSLLFSVLPCKLKAAIILAATSS